jgi:hypothetical protein
MVDVEHPAVVVYAHARARALAAPPAPGIRTETQNRKVPCRITVLGGSVMPQ